MRGLSQEKGEVGLLSIQLQDVNFTVVGWIREGRGGGVEQFCFGLPNQQIIVKVGMERHHQKIPQYLSVTNKNTYEHSEHTHTQFTRTYQPCTLKHAQQMHFSKHTTKKSTVYPCSMYVQLKNLLKYRGLFVQGFEIFGSFIKPNLRTVPNLPKSF